MLKYIITVDRKITAGGYECLCYRGKEQVFSRLSRDALHFDTRREAAEKMKELKACLSDNYCRWGITVVQDNGIKGENNEITN